MSFFDQIFNKSYDEMKKEKRISDRKRCNLPIFAIKDDQVFKGLITDVSVYGMQIEIPVKLPKDAVINIQADRSNEPFYHNTAFKNDTVKAKIIRVSNKTHFDRYMYGIKYFDTKENLLDSFVFYLIKYFGFNTFYKSQKREYVRFTKAIKLKYQEPLGYHGGNGTLIDINDYGMALTTFNKLPKKIQLDVTLEEFEKVPCFTLRGEVMWVGLLKECKTAICGIKFGNLTNKQKELLKKLITAIVESNKKQNLKLIK